jgi:hypothetical protein
MHVRALQARGSLALRLRSRRACVTCQAERNVKDVKAGFRWDPAMSRWVRDDSMIGFDAPVEIQPRSGAAYTVRPSRGIEHAAYQEAKPMIWTLHTPFLLFIVLRQHLAMSPALWQPAHEAMFLPGHTGNACIRNEALELTGFCCHRFGL